MIILLVVADNQIVHSIISNIKTQIKRLKSNDKKISGEYDIDLSYLFIVKHLISSQFYAY